MSDISFDLTFAKGEKQPFPHFSINKVLPDPIVSVLFDWFQECDAWKLVETSFYEQYEFSLFQVDLPVDLKFLISKVTLIYLEERYCQLFGVNQLQIVDTVAHKLVNDQHIGIHNDYINGEETHRMILHINPFWKEKNGGLLLLFGSSKAEDLAKIIRPLNNTVFGFEISRTSHHAVSKIYDYMRYTIVYTFKQIQ